MADRTNIANDFARQLAQHGVRLPLRHSVEDIGSVLDADGNEVLVVDPNNETPDEQATSIALLIIAAVNTCGGLPAEEVEPHG